MRPVGPSCTRTCNSALYLGSERRIDKPHLLRSPKWAKRAPIDMKPTIPVPVRLAVLFVAIALLSVGILWMIPDNIAVSDLTQIGVVDLLFIIAVLIAHEGASRYYVADAVYFRCSLVLWFFLLISQELFNRQGGNAESAIEGRFPTAAYGELSLWTLACFVLALLDSNGHSICLRSQLDIRSGWAFFAPYASYPLATRPASSSRGRGHSNWYWLYLF